MSQTCRTHGYMIQRDGDDDIWASVYHRKTYDSFGLYPEVVQKVGGYQRLIEKIGRTPSWPVSRPQLPRMPPPNLAEKNLAFMVTTLHVFENEKSTKLYRFSISQQELKEFLITGKDTFELPEPCVIGHGTEVCGEVFEGMYDNEDCDVKRICVRPKNGIEHFRFELTMRLLRSSDTVQVLICVVSTNQNASNTIVTDHGSHVSRLVEYWISQLPGTMTRPSIPCSS
jgi:hypothetical protein